MSQYSLCNSPKGQRTQIDLKSLCATAGFEANLTLWPDNVITTVHDAHRPKITFPVSLPCKENSGQTVNEKFIIVCDELCFEYHKPME